MNFILRTITNECNDPLNKIIGNSYAKKHKKPNYKEWENIVKMYYPDIKKEVINTIKCIILCGEAILIYEDTEAYIMMENGKTFERLN